MNESLDAGLATRAHERGGAFDIRQVMIGLPSFARSGREMKHRVDALQRMSIRLRFLQLTANDLNLLTTLERAARPHQTSDRAIARFHQRRHDATANEASGSGHEKRTAGDAFVRHSKHCTCPHVRERTSIAASAHQ
jgi:hypothetical protein